MAHQESHIPELPNILAVLKEHFPQDPVCVFLDHWQNVIYSFVAIGILCLLTYLATRKMSLVPGRWQSLGEIIVEGVDSLICGVLGPQGRRYVPFLGTLFIYILTMNLMGLIPFLKSPTSSWSTTLAFAICVFCYVQYTAFRHLGVLGYADHLAGNPRGFFARSLILPAFMFVMHIISELVKPLSLSLRLRSNIWGDDLLLAVLTGFGLQGFPLLLVNTFSALLVAFIQAFVFFLLSTVYFALILTHEE